MSSKYTLSEAQKMEFAASVLLKKLQVEKWKAPVLLEGADKDLESQLEWMLTKDYLEIQCSGESEISHYTPAKAGRDLLKKYADRLQEFISVFDVYCAVDLEEGVFAFQKYFEMDDSDWREYLDLDRWDDLRIAVAEYKDIDTLGIVFFSFVQEQRFDTHHDGWQFDLMLGSVWDEVLEVCNTALCVDDLAYETDEGLITGEDVIRDVIRQGVELNIELKNIEDELLREGKIRHPRQTVNKDYFKDFLNPNYKSEVWN
jgi:hypothetical protein